MYKGSSSAGLLALFLSMLFVSFSKRSSYPVHVSCSLLPPQKAVGDHAMICLSPLGFPNRYTSSSCAGFLLLSLPILALSFSKTRTTGFMGCCLLSSSKTHYEACMRSACLECAIYEVYKNPSSAGSVLLSSSTLFMSFLQKK